MVDEGQLLARLDDSIPRAELELARSQLEAARRYLREVDVQLRQARLDLQRTEELAERELASQADLDRNLLSVEGLVARLESGRQDVVVAERSAAVHHRIVQDMQIRAPFAGIVIAKAAQPGEMISPVSAGGGFTRTGICTIVDMDSLEVEVDVNESYINRVYSGQPVRVALNAYPDDGFAAKVIAIIPAADRNKATVRVRIGFVERDERVLPDMGVRVAFLERRTTARPVEKSGGVLVPGAAIARDSRGEFVLVVADGEHVRRAVVPGDRQGSQVRVLKGLNNGEQVVADLSEELLASLAEGSKVSFVRSPQPGSARGHPSQEESPQPGSARGHPSQEESPQPGSARGHPSQEESPQPGSARGHPSQEESPQPGEREGPPLARIKRSALALTVGVVDVRRGTEMGLVNCRGVEKGFVKGRETVEVLTGIDLEIQKGDFLALMGPSGSGKTTLLNLIGGLDYPTAGVVEVGGRALDGMTGRELAKWRSENVGFIFQFYNLLPVLSAQRNVELPLLLTRLSGKQRRRNAATALEIVGLTDRAGHKPGELSGGQQQRVAIARAIVADPTLLLCDEPTGDLDRETADEILTLLETLNRDHGKTIVIVTHDPKAAEHATHTLFMDKGKLTGWAA